jgi:hypothetical protein
MGLIEQLNPTGNSVAPLDWFSFVMKPMLKSLQGTAKPLEASYWHLLETPPHGYFLMARILSVMSDFQISPSRERKDCLSRISSREHRNDVLKVDKLKNRLQLV